MQETSVQAVEQPETCKQCGSGLKDGYCSDGSCSFSDWPQRTEIAALQTLSTSEVEALYSVKKRRREIG